jgi:uncharacterized protein YndB with AHSA1/START domain
MAELTCEVLVKADPATIFELLTDPENQTWLGTDAQFDLKPGGIYKVSVLGNHPALGEFIEVVPNEKIVFTFGWNEPGHPIPAGSTTVAITLIREGDETRVRLVHSGLPDDAVTDHTQGWTTLLDRLAVTATGGDPAPLHSAGEPS